MKDGTTVVLTFEGRLPDGTVYDKMTKDDPLKFQVGHNLILDGLEREVREMSVGEKKTFTIKDYEAFGEYLDDRVEDVPIDLMPNLKGLEVGKVIWVIAEENVKVPVTVRDITGEYVRLDCNHPLAGKDITFDVEILEIDESTADPDGLPRIELTENPLDMIM